MVDLQAGLLASQCAETAATRLLKLGSVEVAAKDKDLVQRLEASLIHWTRQIKELTTQQDSTHEDEGAGPLEEIEFWRARDVDLSRLYIHDDLFFYHARKLHKFQFLVREYTEIRGGCSVDDSDCFVEYSQGQNLQCCSVASLYDGRGGKNAH